jgi:hypothetical protein
MSNCTYYGRKVPKTTPVAIPTREGGSSSERPFPMQPTYLQPSIMRSSSSLSLSLSLSLFYSIPLPLACLHFCSRSGFPWHPTLPFVTLCTSGNGFHTVSLFPSPLCPPSSSLLLPNHRLQGPLTKRTTVTEFVGSFTFQRALLPRERTSVHHLCVLLRPGSQHPC